MKCSICTSLIEGFLTVCEKYNDEQRGTKLAQREVQGASLPLPPLTHIARNIPAFKHFGECIASRM